MQGVIASADIVISDQHLMHQNYWKSTSAIFVLLEQNQFPSMVPPLKKKTSDTSVTFISPRTSHLWCRGRWRCEGRVGTLGRTTLGRLFLGGEWGAVGRGAIGWSVRQLVIGSMAWGYTGSGTAGTTSTMGEHSLFELFSLTLKWLGHFFQNVILFSNVVQY